MKRSKLEAVTSIRITASEYERWSSAADAEGRSLSNWIRDRLASRQHRVAVGKPKPKPEPATVDSILTALVDLVAEAVVRKLGERDAPVGGMVTVQAFAKANAIAVTTVRAMLRDGRLQGVRIGKRQWRVRANAVVQPPTGSRAALGRLSPKEQAARILARFR